MISEKEQFKTSKLCSHFSLSLSDADSKFEACVWRCWLIGLVKVKTRWLMFDIVRQRLFYR